MTIQLSVGARNARLDAIETECGVDPVLKIYNLSGSAPANCAAAISGDILSTITLPTDWMNAASSGSKTKNGTWQDTSADASGVADFFRLFKSDGTTCVMQGTVTATSGGGDMELDNTSVAAGQQITISTFTLTDGNS